MVSNVSNAGSARSSKAREEELKRQREARAKGEIIVERGMTVSELAKKFKMSVDDFKKMTGLKSSALTVGKPIKGIPNAVLQSGKGLSFLARSHGMTLKEFCNLNGIDENYKPQKGEAFYVFPQKTPKKETSAPQPAPQPSSVTQPAPETSAGDKQQAPLKSDEIADGLENSAKNLRGAVGQEEFDNIFNQINKDNVIEVVTKFQEKHGKSLINMISDEWSSSKKIRKDAMTKIYDLTAQAKGVQNTELREAFINNLNEEFDSWGFVSTKKMDAIINGIINPNTAAAATEPKSAIQNERKDNTGSTSSHLSGKTYPNEVFHSTNGGRSKDITPTTITSIKDKDGNYVNAGTLKNWAISGGKRDKGFADVKDPFIVRPLPNYNTETKKIEAVTEVLDPTTSGSLNGKVVVLNPGHGGYQQKNGYFDAGTVLSVKNAEGKQMPIEEWRVAQSYVEKISDNLRARGAKVVIVSGAVRNGGMSSQQYIENMFAGKKGCDEVRDLMHNTNKSNMLMLSVHVESAKEKPKDKKCTVRYTKDIDKKLSDNINNYVRQGFSSLTPVSTQDNLYINRAAQGVTSSLLEIGNIANGQITNSLLSNYDQKKYAECIANAIEATLLE